MATEPGIIVYAAAWSQSAPAVAAVARRLRVSTGAQYAVLLCLILVAGDQVLRLTASSNNLWVTHIVLPLATAAALWAISCWLTGIFRRAIRIAVPIIVLVIVLMGLLVENSSAFFLVTGPFAFTTLLLVASSAFVLLALRHDGVPFRRDWFWVFLGLIVYAGVSATMGPVYWFLASAGETDLLVTAIRARAAVQLLAFAAITLGVLWSTPPQSSGGSSSPPFSPSPSSPGHSASP